MNKHEFTNGDIIKVVWEPAEITYFVLARVSPSRFAFISIVADNPLDIGLRLTDSVSEDDLEFMSQILNDRVGDVMLSWELVKGHKIAVVEERVYE